MYPALAVLETLQQLNSPSFDVLWVGGEGGMEAELVKRSGIRYQAIPAAGVHGVGLRALPANLLRIGRGIRAARRILQHYRPDVIFYTGGYVAAPMAIASQTITRKRPRSLIFVPDIEPGLAHKFLARYADHIAVTTDDSLQFFRNPTRVSVTGYPTRTTLRQWDRSKAQKVLGLTDDMPVLLVFGGSKGARSINRALITILDDLLDQMQVIHISGASDWSEVEETARRLPGTLAVNYHPFPYLHTEMGAALSAADLVVSRAGASSLGEFPLFNLPAILIPYPYAWRYQKVNASYLEQRGAAIVVQDEDLTRRLREVILGLVTAPDRLASMSSAMGACARPGASESIAQLLVQIAENPSRESVR